jgi:hypothetical protein
MMKPSMADLRWQKRKGPTTLRWPAPPFVQTGEPARGGYFLTPQVTAFQSGP